MPTWKPPKAPVIGACTDAQLQQRYDDCNTASPVHDAAACDAFNKDPANTACLACLFTTADADQYSAVIIEPQLNFANVPGCMALLDGDASSTGCAAKRQADMQCRIAACLNNCPDSYDACAKEAGTTVCKPYHDAATCSTSPVYARCTQYSTYLEYYLAIGKIFCTAGP